MLHDRASRNKLGVSTADRVSELSGRGVGMAAVRDAVLRLGGTIDVRSVPGARTTIEIELSEATLLALDAPSGRSRTPLDATG